MNKTLKIGRTLRRSTEVSAPREAGAHYTPEGLASDFVTEALRVWAEPWSSFSGHELWERETDILDPACGDGDLLACAAVQIMQRLKKTSKHQALATTDFQLIEKILPRLRGVELREDAARQASLNLPGARITQGDGLRATCPEGLVLMNPPWLGRSKRSPSITTDVKRITGSGTADLSVAFLRAFPQARQISAILPKACSQGDSREAGLQAMLARRWVIRSATTARMWPGAASVMYITVHMRRDV